MNRYGLNGESTAPGAARGTVETDVTAVNAPGPDPASFAVGPTELPGERLLPGGQPHPFQAYRLRPIAVTYSACRPTAADQGRRTGTGVRR